MGPGPRLSHIHVPSPLAHPGPNRPTLVSPKAFALTVLSLPKDYTNALQQKYKLIINFLGPTGEIVFSNILFYPNISKIISLQDVINIQKLRERYFVGFFYTKSLKSGVDFLLIGHLS